MHDSSVRQYRFGEFILEPREERLFRMRLEPIDLTGKPFQVLVALVARRGELVTREELLQEVWGGISVADQAVTEAIFRVRKALDPNDPNKYIKTVTGRGYRFVAEVVIGSELAESVTAAAREDEKPSLSPGRARTWRFVFGGLVALIAVFALLAVRHVRHSKPQLPESAFQRAARLEGEGEDGRALETLERIPASDPDYGKARIHAAWLLYQADKDDEAARSLALVTNGNGKDGKQDDGTGLKMEGLERLLAGNVNGALTSFQMASEADPADIDSLIYIADIANDNNMPDKANKALARCFQLEKQNPFCGFERINALTLGGDYDAAIGEYTRLREVMTYPWLDEPAGYAELAKDNVPEAVKHFDKIAEVGRGGSAVHFMAAQDGIGIAEALEGKLVAAHIQLNTAMGQTESTSEKADYDLELAKMDALEGDSQKALGELQDASRLSDFEEFTVPIARTFAMAADFKMARHLLTQQDVNAPQLGPRYGAAIQFVEGLESLKAKKAEMAVEQLESSFRIDQSSETAYFLAQAQMSLRNWKAAIDTLNFVLGHRGRIVIEGVPLLIPLAERDLGTCFRQLGNESEANAHFQIAREIWANADSELKAQLSQ